jgi:hypothetical protein
MFKTARKKFSRAKAAALAATIAPVVVLLLKPLGFEIPVEVVQGFIASAIGLSAYFIRAAID